MTRHQIPSGNPAHKVIVTDDQRKRLDAIRKRLKMADIHDHLGTAGKELLRLCDVLTEVWPASPGTRKHGEAK